MGMFTVNRQQRDTTRPFVNTATGATGEFLGGCGLPFQVKQLNQTKYQIDANSSIHGCWHIPNNRFPTFQVGFEGGGGGSLLLYKTTDNTNDADELMGVVPPSRYEVKCYELAGVEYNTIIMRDKQENNLLECGFYYFELAIEGYPNLFSEKFHVWKYLSIEIDLTGIVDSITPTDANLILTHKILGAVYVDIVSATFNGALITGLTSTFAVTIPHNVPQEMETVMLGTNGETYRQTFEITHSLGAFSDGLTIDRKLK